MKKKFPKALNYLDTLLNETEEISNQNTKRNFEKFVIRVLSNKKKYANEYATMPQYWWDHYENSKFIETYQKYEPQIPKRQSIINYSILQDLKENFDMLITKEFRDIHRYKVSNKVYFGTIESNFLNAMIFPVPNSEEYLIIFNSGLWESLMAVSYYVTASFDYDNFPFLNFNPEKAKKFIPKFVNLIERILLLSEIKHGYPLPPTNSMQDFRWTLIDDAMHSFVFGHEYAHFLHSHFNENEEEKKIDVNIGKNKYKYNKTNWHNEYEADRTGLDLTVFRQQRSVTTNLLEKERKFEDTFKAEGTITAVEGVLLFLHFLCQLLRVKGIVYNIDSSHPPTWLRIAAVMSTLGKQVLHKPTLSLYLKRIQQLVDCLEFYFRNLPSPFSNLSDISLVHERIFQDAVFKCIFNRTTYNTILDLKALHMLFIKKNNLQGNPFQQRDHQGQKIIKHWHYLLTESVRIHKFSQSEISVVINRCIAILEKNADNFGVSRPL